MLGWFKNVARRRPYFRGMTRPTLVFALIAALACQQAEGNAFDRAASAATSAKFKEAAKLYAEAATAESDPVRRAKAEIRLANIEWRVFQKHDHARARLRRAVAGPHEAFDAQIELARVAFDADDFNAARVEARKAMKIAKTRRERGRAIAMLARAVLEGPKHDQAEIGETIASLKGVIAEQGPFTEPSRLLLKAALIAGDGATAMEAVNGYYHVSKYSGPPNAIAAAHASLTRVLPTWRGTDAERPAIVEALGGIRFFEEAALVSRGPATDVVNYAKTLERIEDVIETYYRAMANDDEDDDDMKDGIDRELRALWPSISKKKYDRKKAEKELARRFGTYILIGKTGGFIDAHVAHVVGDRNLPIEQYGRKATMRFVELDALVSNGFGTFLSDGRGGDGGWATETEIYQVRPGYANGPLEEWHRLFDDDARALEENEMAEETVRDRERAKTRPIGDFPGLAKRLQKQYRDQVIGELRAKGLSGEPLRDAFLARVEGDEFQYSIVLHEGRHAIDKLSKESFKTWELEYRAKLSEIALADAPRASLQSVLDNTIGGESPHGKANEHLAKGLVTWMEAHRGAIKGLDPALPMLPQADKLTDEQIKAAVRSLDPLAR